MDIYDSHNKPFPVLSIQLIESLDYSSVVLRITSATAPEDTVFNVPAISGSVKFVVFMSDFNQNVFVSWMYPDSFFNCYTKIFSGFTGFSTIEDLSRSVGFQYDGPRSLSTFWEIPPTSIPKLLSLLTKSASIEGGGAPHFYVNINNHIQCVDYKYSIDKCTPVQINGEATSSSFSSEWFTQIPGQFHFIKFFPDGTEEEDYIIESGTLKSQVSCYFATRDASNTINQAYKNQFYDYMYSTYVVNVNLNFCANTGLGTCVKLSADGKPLVVRSRTLNISGEVQTTTNLQLVSCS